MTSAEIVRTRLLAVSAVTAIVGTKIYNVFLPQSFAPPAIRVQRISGDEEMHLRGGVNHWQARVQVDIIASMSGYVTALAIDAAIMGNRAGSALAFFRGELGTSPSEVFVEVISPDGQPRDMVDPLEPKQMKVSRDFMVSYRMN